MAQDTNQTTESTDQQTGLTIDRRGYLKSSGALAGLALSGVGSATPGSSGGKEQHDFAERFADPDRDVQPKFRWWWPHGKVDPDEIAAEIDEMADAGFGGVEIADVHHSVSQKDIEIDPAEYGWGTEAWKTGLKAALRAAKDREMSVDLTIGPAWPAAVPSVTPDSDAAAKELVFGRTSVDAGETHDGPVPDPVQEPGDDVSEKTLVALQAARVAADSSPDASEVVLEPDSVRNLTDDVESGGVRWTAPDEGTWLLISYWQRGSAQQPEAGPHTEPPSYVVDHFSEKGTEAIVDFWEENILTPTIRDLVEDVGGALFEDSLEMEGEGQTWTPNLRDEFEERMGYSLDPYLPLIVSYDDDPVFSYGGDTGSQVRRDYWETFSHLFIEHHYGGLKEWGDELDLDLRGQPYGLETDAIAKSAVLDIPEGESLGFSNSDDYRCLAGGRDMGGNKILSEEAGAYWRGAYNTTWEEILTSLNNHFAAGLNQTVFHGYSYADAPGAQWPGFAAFTPYDDSIGYSGSWGPRQPTWTHVQDISGYLSRTHQLLQSATSKVDAAILRQKGYAGTGFGGPWFTDHGVNQGYSYQFLSPELFTGPNATVSDGRLAPDGPAYKTLVVYQDDFAGANTMEVKTAERILEFAKNGLAVIVVGDDYDVPGIPQPGEDEALDAVMSELLSQPTVSQVANEADVPVGLNEQNVTPAVAYDDEAPLVSAHRAGKNVDYYYLHNSSDEEVTQSLSLVAKTPQAIPYRLDAWTGEIERIAVYEEVEDRIRTSVTVPPHESAIVAVGRRDWYNDQTGVGLHATSSDATEVRADDESLVVRDTSAGTYATTLSNGKTVESTIESLPAEREVNGWHLSVEDWRPGDSPTETITKHHELELDQLKPWLEIPELENVSGVGTYTTTVELGEDWAGSVGAYLDLGDVFDTFQITVNGEQLPPVSQVAPVADVGPYLEPGSNTIKVEVATTLNNRLKVARSDIYGIAEPQEYGLLGPVKLVPYGEVSVSG